MRPSNTFLLLQLVLFLSRASSAPLFAEYIGAQFNGVKFSDVPVNTNVPFHFILAFAIDYDSSTSPPTPTNGNFNIFWDSTNLSPSDVSAIKSQYPNVKVALSLGGATVSGQPVNFSPTSVDTWVANAVSSLTTIIQQYNLDGIDIDYENFAASGDTATFSSCIGQLVTALKNNGLISFASIAPFDNSDVQSHYQALWANYASVIDYVNFQFYAYDSSTTVSQFLNYYNTQEINYGSGKVLVSMSTASGAGGLSPANGFFTACSDLQNQGKLNGIFIWSADDSKANGFQYETQAQSLLAGSS
ncbi:hypothetical protein MLD38_005819 [Melastoma candidum]|uniref:Uncharacterized protein n=1 Tax=Melastoma candidum TaxID=119954 RepID=A0ACB9RM38_9MYRT|nr:hypothetical protein MLD38_005819 [Melastoma candidum]